MHTPLISIITINFNNAAGLEQTIQSVVAQSFSDYEYIIIDGASTDKSVEIIQQYANHITYWVSEPDKGIYNAMNKGINRSRGRYVAFMNSGDIYLNNNILGLVAGTLTNEQADVFYGQIIVNEQGIDRTVVYPEILTLDYQRNMVINHQACFFYTQTMRELGGYNEQYRLAADYAYYLQAVIANKTFFPILFPLVRYDVSGISSVRMDEYRKEMRIVWDAIVPALITQSVDQSIQQSERLHHHQNSRIMKAAVRLQKLIKFLKRGTN